MSDDENHPLQELMTPAQERSAKVNFNEALNQGNLPSQYYTSHKKQRGVRVLCCDGGGMRGLVEIEMLRQISVALYGDDTGRKLLDEFDLIAGTSTGGILAASLAAGKTLKEVEDLYFQLGENIFGAKWTYWAGRMSRYMWNGDYYSSASMELFIKENLKRDSLLTELEKKLFLVATDATKQLWNPYLFRSYENPQSKFHGTAEASIIEAVRATSAAPGYFKPEQFGNLRLIDGGLVANNPTEIAFMEARTLWPDRHVDLVLSLGTGNPDNPVIARENLENIVISIVDMETSSVVIHQRVKNWLSLEYPYTGYFRFSPAHLGSVQMDVCDPQILKSWIETAKEYMSSQKHKMEEIKSILSGSGEFKPNHKEAKFPQIGEISSSPSEPSDESRAELPADADSNLEGSWTLVSA